MIKWHEGQTPHVTSLTKLQYTVIKTIPEQITLLFCMDEASDIANTWVGKGGQSAPSDGEKFANNR